MDLSRYIGTENQEPADSKSEPLSLTAVEGQPAHKPEKQSYIGSAVTGLYRTIRGFEGGNGSSLVADLQADQQRIKFEQELAHYGGGFLKTATLFLRGRFALPLTLAVYALDEAKPGDSIARQLTDAGLGAAKGGTMRAAFGLSHRVNDIAAKGVTLGIASRASELGLSRETYQDDSGRFDFGLGARRFGEGVFAPKAVAFDVVAFGASNALLKGADNALGGAVMRSPFLSTMLTGTTFGVTVGGLEELQKQSQAGTFDIGEIGKRAAIRGAIDTFAAVPGGLQARAHYNALRNEVNQQPRRLELTEQRLADPTARLGEMPMSVPFKFELATGPKLAELTQKLGTAREGQLAIKVENPDRPTDFQSEAHFLQTGTKQEIVDARMYSYRDTDIALPESYAKQLDRVREYRTEMAKHPESEHAALADRMLGSDAHLAQRALPEDFIRVIDLLPDASMVRRFTLLNSRNPEDVWFQKLFNDPTFTSAAATSLNGEITFFRRNVDALLPTDVRHEWTHVVRYRDPVGAGLFDAAAKIEHNGYMQRNYASTKAEENFAIHAGEQFLHPDADFFHTVATEAPVRTAIIAQSLKPIIEQSQSPSAQMYRERIKYVEETVAPVAREQLLAILRNGRNDSNYDSAARLLLHLTPPAELSKIAELKDMNLAYTTTTDSSMPLIAALGQRLENLNLTGTPITRESTKSLYGMTGLRRLSLAETPIDDSSTWVLSSLKNVRELDLSNTQISDRSIRAISEMPALEVIDLSGTGVTASGIARLRAQHPNGSKLQILQ